ncbi:MAG TPA: AAA family ATPase [Acidimicrobiales bacterium]|nr:AAA family ATPase [Acidimicrobiales bacterium]
MAGFSGRGQNPVPVEDVGAPSRGAAPGRLSAPVLVARSQELAALTACVESAPAIAVVEGEAGVGKTRLVTELMASRSAAGRLALVGQCHPLRDPFPLGPVVEALRGVGHRAARLSLSPLAGALRPLLPELADHLPPPPDPLADPRMERHRLWRAVVELLGSVGAAVVVLEDLHWADEATAEFLVFLATQLPPNVVLVVTWRPADIPSASPLPALAARPSGSTMVVRVALAPLAPADVKALVQSILASDAISDEFIAYLHERTAGIPFAVEEVLRLLQDRRDLVRWEGRWARRGLDRLEVPAAIRESIGERVARLADGPRQLVEAAAVLGEPADEALLGAVAGLPAARANAALVGALAAALLQETRDGHYGFRHALATDAVYATIPGPTRRRLHQRAARAMEKDDGQASPAQLARHCKEGGQPLKWVRHAQAAAASAAALGDHGAATAFLLDALSARRLPATTRGEVTLELSIAALHALDHGDAVAAVAAAVEDPALPAELRGKLAFNLGSLLHQAGDASGSRRAIAVAVPRLDQQPALRALAMSALASPWVVEGHVDEHLDWLDRADALATEHPEDDIGAALRANRAAVLLAVGSPVSIGSTPEPPPPGATGWDLQEWVRTCTNMAVNDAYLGRYGQARRWVSEAMRASESLGYDRLAGSLRATELVVRWATGEWSGLAEEAAVLENDALDVPSTSQAAVVRGLVELAGGHVEEAVARLAEAAERAKRCGAIPTMGMACAGLARVRLSRGEDGEARAVALRALGIVAAKGVWAWAADIAPVAVEALVACGERAEAAEWAQHFDAGLKGREAPAAAAAALHCRALVAAAFGQADAVGILGAAEKAWAALPRPYDAALVAETRGRVLLNSDREAGATALFDALAGFRSLGAAWDEARLRQELRRRHVALPQQFRGGRRSYDDELSPREREVIELAGGGASSAQIAKRLFLSPRTVDHHIERALPKLGLSSRKELVAARQAAEAETAADGSSKIG